MSNKTKVLKAFFNAQMSAMTAASLETIERLNDENKALSKWNESLCLDLSSAAKDLQAQEQLISKLRRVNVDLDLKLKALDSNPANGESQDLKEERAKDEDQCNCPGCTIARLLSAKDDPAPIFVKVNISDI